MTLVACRECSGRVSRSAKACPRCGAPYPEEPEAWFGILRGLSAAVLSIAFSALSIVAAIAIPALAGLAMWALAMFAFAVLALSVFFIA